MLSDSETSSSPSITNLQGEEDPSFLDDNVKKG